MSDPLNPNWKNKWKRKLKDTAISLTLILGTYQGIQLNYTKKQIANFFYEPKEFREFKKHTGITLNGFEESLDPEETIKIIQILNLEKLAKEQLSKISIESKNYDEKSNIGKIIEKLGFHGIANPLTNTITLNVPLSKLFIHELAHIKTYSMTTLFSKGEFLEEWEQLQEKYKYKYNSKKENITYYYSKAIKDTTLSKLIDNNSSEFVSNYAKTNKYEDISEIVEDILYAMYYNPNNIKDISNPVLKEKINILIKYDLLPKETKEYITVKSEYIKWIHSYAKLVEDTTNNTSTNNEVNILRKNYINNSKKFIDTYPESFMYNNIIINRSVAIYTQNNKAEKNVRTESTNNLINALNYPEKIGYLGVIKELERLNKYNYSKNPETNPYTIALIEYDKKLNNLDMNILTDGVTDKLIELKILKDDSNGNK